MFFNGYLETFLEKNSIPYNVDKMEERTLNREKRIREIMKDIFESKYGINMEDSKLGNLIMDSYNFMMDDEIDFDKLSYNILFYNKDSVKIDFTKFDILNGLTKIRIESEESIISFKDEDLKNKIANILGVDAVNISSWRRIDDNYAELIISSVEYIVNTDELESFDCQKKYEYLQKKAEEYNKTQLETNQEIDR